MSFWPQLGEARWPDVCVIPFSTVLKHFHCLSHTSLSKLTKDLDFPGDIVVDVQD